LTILKYVFLMQGEDFAGGRSKIWCSCGVLPFHHRHQQCESGGCLNVPAIFSLNNPSISRLEIMEMKVCPLAGSLLIHEEKGGGWWAEYFSSLKDTLWIFKSAKEGEEEEDKDTENEESSNDDGTVNVGGNPQVNGNPVILYFF
jgi:hypothetical protein